MQSFTLKSRSKFWPKCPLDWGVFTVTLVLMPTIYMHEMFTVRPTVWRNAPFFSNFVIYGGLFVFLNIVANFVGLVVTDTRVPDKVMSTVKQSPHWKYCDLCISYVPPRAWHCKVCKVCILKRDHHCLFAGCCVGHFNSRFFIMYLVYVCIGTLYCVISDSIFLINKVDLRFPSVVLKIGFPAFAYLSGVETFTNECFILLFIINLAAFIFVCVLLRFHVRIILNGQVTYDVKSSSSNYDYGKMENVKEVLGCRWYVAWAFPLVSSPLPRSGLEWDTSEEWKLKRQRVTEKSK
ncbi:probable palmitoyltransferase ZDHHC24 [Thrips palmi]|uniref:Palmitoyltransferase n=1 Tax=Thrips palmi TaxID=161013 RepID=A0A6P9ADK2_THRPL|nr:probable palmitoyltransferase ZDHHC24 [Thrips palmi]